MDILPAWDDALRRTASFRGVYPSGFLFLSSVSALCLVLWCIILLRNSRYRLLWPPVCWLVLVFLSYGLWRYRFSDSLILAEDEVLRLLLLASAFFFRLFFLYRQDTLQVCPVSDLHGSFVGFLWYLPGAYPQ